VNIDKKDIRIGVCAFCGGVILSLLFVLVSTLSYRLGRSDAESAMNSPVPPSNNKVTPTRAVSIGTPLEEANSTQVVPCVFPTSPEEPSPVQLMTYASPVAQTSLDILPLSSPDTKTESVVRERVMTYMYKVDSILSSVNIGEDPSQFARQLISSSLEGNTSGFEKLINDYNNTRDMLLALNVPTECQEYHQGCINLMNMGIELLKDVKGGIESQDINRLTLAQTKAATLKDETNKVDHVGLEILKKYNIPAPGK